MNREKISEIIKNNDFNPINGLPEELFQYASSIVPMINVDLLIKDEMGRSLLSWRDDSDSGKGWHIPGGIIRYKEPAINRIIKVSELEIGHIVFFNSQPIAVNEIIADEKSIRGHFISLLYNCFLASSMIIDNKELSKQDAGYLMWHESCPNNILSYHEIYRKYINDTNCRLHI